MSTVALSLVVASNRKAFLQRFCGSFLRDAVVRERPSEFEVIFVGPLDDDPAAYPVQVRFIRSAAGAAACWEIGSRAARGRLLGLAADDCVFSDGFLDNVLVMADGAGPYDMFTARYVHNGVCQLAGQRMMSQPYMPLLPVGGFAFAAAHRALGGIDRRFRAVLWDTDLYQSFVQAGGRASLVGGHTCHEINNESRLFVDNHQHDRAVLDSLWLSGGRYGPSRLSPRLGYTDAELAAL